ncbi:MAG: GTA-gp10 family protein [Parvularculaceae bacterium]
MDRRPGDAEIEIDGEPRVLRATLGALAEIEETVGGGDFAAAATRLANPRVADLLLMLRALLKGGGADMSLEALRASDVDLAAAAAAVSQAFGALAETPGQAPGKPEAPPPPAGPSPGRTGS